jgi:hypothetical protein
MDVQFFQIFADSFDAKVDYINQKLAHSPQCLPRAAHWATATEVLNEAPLVAEAADWPKLSSVQKSDLKRRIKCATKMADRFLPLAEAETIEEDSFSYLTSPWGHAAQGVPVLRRTTNQAVIYCFFDEFEVAPDQKDPLRPLPVVEDAVGSEGVQTAPIEPVGFGIEEIALDIAKALLEELASFAIEKVMGSSVPDYFGEVYDEIRKIVAQELDAHMIREISDEFVAAQIWNNNHYLPFKRSVPPPDPRDLADEMNFNQATFYHYLSKLMDPQVAKLALGEFLIGASMQLAFLQELFAVTGAPHWQVELSLDAALWADKAQDAWKAISDSRSGMIKVQADGDCVPVNGASKCSYYYTSYDYFAETWGSKFFYQASDGDSEKKAKARAEAEAGTRRLAAIDGLRTKLGKPEATIATWRALISADSSPARSAAASLAPS